MLVVVRDLEVIETELMEISAVADDTLKLELLITWCASHPDEVPFILHQLLGRHPKTRQPQPGPAAGSPPGPQS